MEMIKEESVWTADGNDFNDKYDISRFDNRIQEVIKKSSDPSE